MKLADLFDELPEDNEETQNLEVKVFDEDGNEYTIEDVELVFSEKRVEINIART